MTETTLQWFKDHFRKHHSSIQDEYIEFLRFSSISADPTMRPQLRACANWIADQLKASGCSVELWNSDDAPIVFGSIRSSNPTAPTVLIYNHYDVQPVDPIDEWDSNPFEPKIEGETVFARGAQDNKGQCLYVLRALQALKEFGDLPCHLKFVIEGEEENGSAALINLLPLKQKHLQADYGLVIDAGIRRRDTPAINLGTRGLISLTVTVTGTKHDLHSGLQGGLAYNPLHALVAILSSLRNPDGSIAVPGFYDSVKTPTPSELEHISLAFDEAEWKKEFGQTPTGGETALPPLVRNWLRPTLEINGVHGGYGGKGSKTVIPREALAKISCRLVPDQDPTTIAKLVKACILSRAPQGVSVDVLIHEGGGNATRAYDTTPAFLALEQAMIKVWGKKPERIFDGASIPIISLLGKASGAEVVTWGVGLDTDQIHAPNERFDFSRMEKGFLTLCLAIIEMANASIPSTK